MSAIGALRLMGRYHLWANQQILQCIDQNGGVSLVNKPCGIYFGTLHDTVAHIAGVDDLWFRRLTQQSTEMYNELYRDGTNKQWKDVFESSWDATREALIRNSERWSEVAQRGSTSSTVQLLDRQVGLHELASYLDTSGNPATRQVGAAMFHVFNHGTHHRGQLHAGLTSLGVAAPALDLPLVSGEFSITSD
jgi:uncharacterized damage-inducible protein DinB